MELNIVLGSNGLLGKKVCKLLSRSRKIIGIDLVKPSTNYCDKDKIYNLLDLKSFDHFELLINSFTDKVPKYVSIIDCSLIRNTNKIDNLDESHKSLMGLLTLGLNIGKWLGSYCSQNNAKGNMVYISSVKSHNAPKFDHYEGLNMTSDIEYGVAKSGLNLAVKDLSVRFDGQVKYNCLAPGGIKGENHQKAFLERYDNSCLLKPGLVDPEEIAKFVELLLDKNCPIIGQTITIDNGWSLK